MFKTTIIVKNPFIIHREESIGKIYSFKCHKTENTKNQ